MSQYSENQFVQSDNHSWSLLFQYITDGSTVLDIGCSSGTLGEVLIKEKHCIVDGMELFHGDAILAEKKLRKVYERNVETDSIDDITGTYDFIIFADVIEHLVNPAVALAKVRRLLKPTGLIVYSIPNMAHISIRLGLLEGAFDYTETGLLDETHLHFYTKKHMENTFAEAGYRIKSQQYTYMNYPDKFVADRLKGLGLTVSDKTTFTNLMNSVEAQAFQFIGCAAASKTTKKHIEITDLPHKRDAEALNTRLQDYEETIKVLRSTTAEQQHMIDSQAQTLHDIHSSIVWKLIKPLHTTALKIKRRR